MGSYKLFLKDNKYPYNPLTKVVFRVIIYVEEIGYKIIGRIKIGD